MNPIKIADNVILLDKERHLKFTWAAIDYLNDKYENGYADAINNMANGGPGLGKKSLDATFNFLVALLLHEDKELTVDKLKDIMPIEKLVEVSPAIIKAIQDGALLGNPQKSLETPTV